MGGMSMKWEVRTDAIIGLIQFRFRKIRVLCLPYVRWVCGGKCEKIKKTEVVTPRQRYAGDHSV